ncbi:MAG TPA: Hsp20/alpha crystallin family protein [Acidimicrobiales bacterium]|nr:Hsp20/alpha crystallin family protein [Acidimicrobiales bacterium]
MALVRSDPFRELDRLAQQLWGDARSRSGAVSVAMDAFRKGDVFLVQIDLPGVESDAIELTVEDNVLTVKAERPSPQTTDGVETLVAERPFGTFSRQMFLGDNLDVERIQASYEAGVLTVTIPVAAHAKARRIEVTSHRERQSIPA